MVKVIGWIVIFLALILNGCTNRKLAKMESKAPTVENNDLVGMTGSADPTQEGNVKIDFQYSQFLRGGSIVIRQQEGLVPPNEQCSNGLVVATFTFPYSTFSYSLATGLPGSVFSYRACVYDAQNNLLGSSALIGVPAHILQPYYGLTAFNGGPGAGHGQIALNIGFPANASHDFGRVKITRRAGSSAAGCEDGDVVLDLSSGFSLGSLVDTIPGVDNGARFSYRACVYDLAQGLRSDADVILNVPAKDLVAPPGLVNFTAVTGASPGEISINVGYPNDKSDLAVVEIRRAQGQVAPIDCNSGLLVRSMTAPNFTDFAFIDTGTPSQHYSYRVCLFDSSGNLTGHQGVLDVEAKCACPTLSPMTETQVAMKASRMDAFWYFLHRDPNYVGHAPKRLFETQLLNAGEKLTLTASSGMSIPRIFPEGSSSIYGESACPTNWKLFFRRLDGSLVLGNPAVPENLASYTNGIIVPENNLKPFIGYRDVGCTTNGTCSGDVYFDNEGLRSTTSPLSTNGCNFTFRLDPVPCP